MEVYAIEEIKKEIRRKASCKNSMEQDKRKIENKKKVKNNKKNTNKNTENRNKKNSQNKKRKSKTNDLQKTLVRFLIKTAVIFGTLYFLFSFVFCMFRMNDNYMFPSFRDGDLGVFIRIANFYPQDVILYEQNGKNKVGRIVAINDQEVEFLKNGGYNINGGPAIDEIPYETHMNKESNVKYPIKLKDGQYFVLNDFRENKNDSRTFGVIEQEQVKGKLLFLLRRRSF